MVGKYEGVLVDGPLEVLEGIRREVEDLFWKHGRQGDIELIEALVEEFAERQDAAERAICAEVNRLWLEDL